MALLLKHPNPFCLVVSLKTGGSRGRPCPRASVLTTVVGSPTGRGGPPGQGSWGAGAVPRGSAVGEVAPCHHPLLPGLVSARPKGLHGSPSPMPATWWPWLPEDGGGDPGLCSRAQLRSSPSHPGRCPDADLRKVPSRGLRAWRGPPSAPPSPWCIKCEVGQGHFSHHSTAD